MSDDFEREERAFAEGLHASVPVESFRPLDPEAIRAAARSSARPARRGWIKGAAAAAAVVAAFGIGAALLPRLSASTAAMPASSGYAAGGEAVTPEPAQADRSNDQSVTGSKVSGTLGEWLGASDAPLSPRSNAVGAAVNGEIYLFGGQSDAPCPPNADCAASVQVLRDGAAYNPATDTWRRIAEAPVALSEGQATVVAGRLYVQRDYGAAAKVYAYDTATDAWSSVTSPSGGGVLVSLGNRLASVAWSTEEPGYYDELYDAATGQWTRLPADPLKASYERTLVQVDEKVLLFAKDLRTASSSKAPVFRVAQLDLATGTWRKLPSSEVVGVGGLAVGNRVVFPEAGSYDGGKVDNWGRAYPAGGIFDPGSGTWSHLPTPDRPKQDGLAYARSSAAGHLMLTDRRLLDPVSRTWLTVPAPPDGNLLGQTVVASPDGILVFGGWGGQAPTARSSYLPLH